MYVYLFDRERCQAPHFTASGTLEDFMAKKWLTLIQSQEQRRVELEKTFKEEKTNLEAEIEQEKPNFEAELLRQGNDSTPVTTMSIVFVCSCCVHNCMYITTFELF